MEKQTLQAEVREERGKGPARRLRAEGKIPAVFYGPGAETTLLAVRPKELTKMLSTERGRNAVIELQLDGKTELAMVKDIEVEPVSRAILHVDFYRVDLGREVEVLVPLKTTGKAAGVVTGGEMTVVFRQLPVRATPDKVPADITVEVSHLELNEVIEVKDIALPEGVRITLPPTRTVISVAAPRKKKDEEAEAAAAAAAAAAAGAAAPGAAPAAEAAAPAKPAKG